MKRRTRLLLIQFPLKQPFLYVLCLSNCALASESSTNASLYHLPLQDLLSIKISSATLTPRSLTTAPASVSLLTRAEIEQLPYRYLHEVLNHVPGFQAFRQAEAADEYYHSARGRRVGTASREVLILINGTRFNRESDNAAGVPGILLKNIEKIELIRGPGSALYGSNAFMGVISITTVKQVNEVAASVSDEGLKQVSGNLNLEVDRWRFDAFASAETEEGQQLNIENNFDGSSLSTRDGGNKLDLRIDLARENFSLELAHYQRKAEDFYVVENVGGRNQTRNSFSYATLKQNLSLNDNWQLELKPGASNARYEPQTVLAPAGFASSFGGSIPPSEEPYKGNGFQDEQSYSFSFFNDWTLSDSQSLQLGGEFRKVEQDGLLIEANFDLSVLPIVYVGDEMSVELMIADPSSTEIYGAFVQYQNQIAEKLELVLGARHDNYSHVGHALSPRAALLWELNTHHTLKLLYGSAFRAPSTNERFFTANSTVIGNPSLQPEEVDTLELNWLYNAKNLGLEASLYESTINQAIQQDFIDSTRTFINSEQDEILRGLEGKLSWYISENWSTSISATHLYDTPESQFRQADDFASLQVNYKLNKLFWNFSATWAGERSMQTGEQRLALNSYLLCAARFAYDINEKQRIAFNVTNLLDENYLTPSQGQVLTRGIANRGREISVQYQLNY